MAYLEWTENELGVGVDAMDHEHRLLIDRMNAVYDGAEKGLPYPEMKKRMDELAAYTVKHFKDEEEYMEKMKFEGLGTHKIIHQQLLTQFDDHMKKFQDSQQVSGAFFSFLKVWLTSHIRGIDRKYGAAQKAA